MGPSVNTEEKIEQLIDAGMNVARLNFSHGTQKTHGQTIERLKRAREKKKTPLAILLDTKGPEIRLGPVKNDSFAVKAGQRLTLVKDVVIGDEKQLQVTPSLVVDALQVGARVLIDDGYLSSTVVEKTPRSIVIEIANSGLIKSYKGVNIPGVDIDLPSMTEQDISDISFGISQGVDLIAASFIRSAEHLLEIKNLLAKQGGSKILVLAKIENSLGVQNFEAILHAADGIMVARGDLGVELPLEEVPFLQKMMIRKCIQAEKPVITATQMLESMIKNPRPTLAEASDVANAIYDSTSAVMLSGETASGLYPIETVRMMKGIVEQAEKNFSYRDFFERSQRPDFHDISSSVALASVRTAYSTQAKAIFCFTSSGFTVRHVCRFRPQMPIIALTTHEKTYHQMALNWGVIPIPPSQASSIAEALTLATVYALKEGLVKQGDLIVATGSFPFGTNDAAKMMLVETISSSKKDRSR